MIAMRNVFVPVLDAQVSAIGFGCASLGSRVAREDGLRALQRAYDAGVTWYDVAPSYGDGEAETNLAAFLLDKRDRVQVCTKVGILPAQTPWLMRKIKPLARAAVQAVPALRRAVATNRPMAAKTPLTPQLIRDSVEASLRRLRTEYIDVLALHGAAENEVGKEDVLRALEEIISAGKARTISVASTLEAGLAAVSRSSIYGIVQVSNSPFEPNVSVGYPKLPDDRLITFVTHSAYGSAGALDKLSEMFVRNPESLNEAKANGYLGSVREVAAAVLLDYALSTNRSGVTLLSMFKVSHLEFNLAHVDVSVDSAWLDSFFHRFL